jgi:ribose 5-phosphate isomerase B
MAERRLPDEAVVRGLVERAIAAVEAGPDAAPDGRTLAPPAPAAAAAQPAPRPEAHAEASDARTVAIGADHGGFALKEVISKHLAASGYGVTDCGTNGPDAVDYPDFAHVVARLVASGACATGIVIDGAGIGSAMAANKVPDTSMARNAREHNYANLLTLGARMIGEGLAIEIVDTFLATPWGAERHGRRVAKITAIEQQYRTPSAEESKR